MVIRGEGGGDGYIIWAFRQLFPTVAFKDGKDVHNTNVKEKVLLKKSSEPDKV